MKFKNQQTKKKLRGGYYTPPDLAGFLSRWIAATNPNSILEPSCGDGAFFEAVAAHVDDPSITAFEIDIAEAKKAKERATAVDLTELHVHARDYLAWATNALKKGARFDAAVGNPPFVRYQYLPESFKVNSESVFKQLGCRFTKHTNAWVPFVLSAFALLRPGGRLGMVVPAEIIHVMHAQPLRSYLAAHARRIIILDPEELWFENTLQGAVLLLAEKNSGVREGTQHIGIVPVRDRGFLLRDPNPVFETPMVDDASTVHGKWTSLLLDFKTRELVRELAESERVCRFDELAEVDVGIVTGANKYFLIADEVVEQFELHQWVHPMFGRSEHCPGVIYDCAQHQANADKGLPTNFVWFENDEVENFQNVKAYINWGESQQLHSRYKCRIRNPWYSVPSVYATEVGLLKRAHHAPRLILNELNAYTTDTAYRIRAKRGDSKSLVFNFLNSLTAVSAEIEGRHYGGGVLELVPSEIEQLLLPDLCIKGADIRTLNKQVQSLPLETVLKRQSEVVLGGIGLSGSDQAVLFDGWLKMRNRRQRS